MPPKRRIQSTKRGPEPERESKFAAATPELATQVVAAQMRERGKTRESPTIYGSEKNPPDEAGLKEILAEIHEKYDIPGDKNNGYLEYIKVSEGAVDLQYTTKLDNYLYNLSLDDLKRFRLHGPPPPKKRSPLAWWYLSPAAYNQKKQEDKAKSLLKKGLGGGGKRKKSKKRKSKRKKSKRKKTKRKK